MSAGRPAYFTTPEELELKVAEYYTYIKGESKEMPYQKTLKDGSIESGTNQVWIREPESPSITGLALFLGFDSRQSLYDYEKRPEYSYSIKRAKLEVEKNYEKYLLSQSATGAIFALKNFGWADKQEVDHTTKGDKIESTAIMFTKGQNG